MRIPPVTKWLAIASAALLCMTSCGNVAPLDLARVYLDSNLDQLQLFANDAVYVAADGVAYPGRSCHP